MRDVAFAAVLVLRAWLFLVTVRATIENDIDGENAEAYRILLDGEKVGGVVITLDKEKHKGDLDLLFVSPEVHSKGIGYAA